MIRSSRQNLLLPLFAILALVGAFALIACGDDDDDAENGDSHGGNNAEVISAINFLSNAGLHDIDVAINDDGEIPGNAGTQAKRAEAVTRLTEWPEDLQASADALADIFAALAAAVDGESPDMEAAGEAATNAHDAEHDFSADVWAHLYAEAGIEGGGGGH